MQKKKNALPNHLECNLLITAMIFGVLVLVWAFFVYISPGCGCSPPVDQVFSQTATAIMATNNHVATLIAETQAVSTSQPSRSEALTAAGEPYPTDATAQMYASIAGTAQAQMMATLTAEMIITETQVP